MLGRSEQPRPDLPRDGPPMRVNRPQFLRPRPRRQEPARIRPQVSLARANKLSNRGPVVRIRHASVQPPPDRLGIDAETGSDVIFAQPRPQQGPAQWLVHRRHLPEREDTPTVPEDVPRSPSGGVQKFPSPAPGWPPGRGIAPPSQ